MHIQGIGLATPGQPIEQSDLLQLAYRYNAETRAQRGRLERIYRGTKVGHRHSVLAGDADGGEAAIKCIERFYGDPNASGSPQTEQRMARYEASAIMLAAEACRAALADSGSEPDEIHQLVTVSCTGFVAPGLDLMPIDQLGLDPGVGRTHIGFMGCHGAINGMRVADAFAKSSPSHRVLLCCVELCTLHFQYGNDPQDAVANALFGDGAAALVIADRSSRQQEPTLSSFRSLKLQDTAAMMSWRIGDEGFRMRLDSQVPDVVMKQLKPFVTDWLGSQQHAIETVGGWVIHPGGPKVIDAVEQSLGLSSEQTAMSRAVLRDFGNMSSPTVLFITERLRRAGVPKPWVVIGFGPGLVIEACLIT